MSSMASDGSLRCYTLVMVALLCIKDITSQVGIHGGEDMFRFEEDCNVKSCYPRYGDIMIGREHRVHVNSTCGQDRMERYCALKDNKNACIMCDRSIKEKNHDIKNLVVTEGIRSRETWWQSKNGEEAVTIQVDLEAEFHFTHLIMNFKGSKPKALMIERSPDYGQNWKPYRYWAEDCQTEFPEIYRGKMVNESDIVCISKYSTTGITPLTNSDFVFKVLEPSMRTKDPYTPSIQNLLKMTNIRIKFVRMHTMGDNYLDASESIKDKYFYSIYSLVVRGSCSCYGHANKCTPSDSNTDIIKNKVYGQCKCEHNTAGANCQICKPFFQDLPWKPAVRREKNVCKRCECNNHAETCSFDASLYSMNIREKGIHSGGVCDCKHNTDGQHCQFCASKHYRNTKVALNDPRTCKRCDCDPYGSEGSTPSESECVQEDEVGGRRAGDCLCKQNVMGSRCDRCKNGFWNMSPSNKFGCEHIGSRIYIDGDPTCKCDELGTVENEGCDKNNGVCVCKRNVQGQSCDKCHDGFWGLSSASQGCIQCDCNPGGSLGTNCRNSDGQCHCRPNIIGRTCDSPAPGHFLPNYNYIIMEAEYATGDVEGKHLVIVRTEAPGSTRDWTGIGFMQVSEGAQLTFDLPADRVIPFTMKYNLMIRYDQTMHGWDNVKVTLLRNGQPRNPICLQTYRPSDDVKHVKLDRSYRYIIAGEFCLEKGVHYQIRLNFDQMVNNRKSSGTILIDSIALLPVMLHFRDLGVPIYRDCLREQLNNDKSSHTPRCNNNTFIFSSFIYTQALDCGCDITGSFDQRCSAIGGQCNCKMNVIARKCDRCAPGTHSMNVHGCKDCNCNSFGSVDNYCSKGKCECKPFVVGNKCSACMRGYYGFATGECKRCQCNNRAETCDETGRCIDCRDNTDGNFCERCIPGFYGRPMSGCLPCQCPGGSTGIQIADTCHLVSSTNTAVCDCPPGYAGDKCDRCAENYFGDPTRRGKPCRKCECNGNIDSSRAGNCDIKTGECLLCTHHTSGTHCERCMDGYHGDATMKQCIACNCNALGSDVIMGACNHNTGQCNCLPNIQGINCDMCISNHWNIASKFGCIHCNCDVSGSRDAQCSQSTGACNCNRNRGGQTCNECLENHYGDPGVQCHRCNCNPTGSMSNSCNPQTGQCECRPGIGGRSCDVCARGTTGSMPNCKPCGQCFDNWDAIIAALKVRTNELISRGRELKTDGIDGHYDEEFKAIQSNLDKAENLLGSSSISRGDMMAQRKKANDLFNLLKTYLEFNDDMGDKLNILRRDQESVVNQHIRLRMTIRDLNLKSKYLIGNATVIHESDINGAFNSTLDSVERSNRAQKSVDGILDRIDEIRKNRMHIEVYILDRPTLIEFNKTYTSNEDTMARLRNDFRNLTSNIMNINEMVCAKRGNPCDQTCGGGGCDKCGGLGCNAGSVNKAYLSEEISTKTSLAVKDKISLIRSQLDMVEEMSTRSNGAKTEAQEAHDGALALHNRVLSMEDNMKETLIQIKTFIEDGAAQISGIQQIIDEVMKLKISMSEVEIQDLLSDIREAVKRVGKVEKITKETFEKKQNSEDLLARSITEMNRAHAIFLKIGEVTLNLKKFIINRDMNSDLIVIINNLKKRAEDKFANMDTIIVEQKQKSDHLDVRTKDLAYRVNLLNNRFTENGLNVNTVMEASDSADEMITRAKDSSHQLRTQYELMKTELQKKKDATDAATKRAKQLKDEALQLHFNYDKIRTDLNNMSKSFARNRKAMIGMNFNIKELEEKTMKYKNEIDIRAKDLSLCGSSSTGNS